MDPEVLGVETVLATIQYGWVPHHLLTLCLANLLPKAVQELNLTSAQCHRKETLEMQMLVCEQCLNVPAHLLRVVLGHVKIFRPE